MKTLLHIIASPRAGESNTLAVSNAYLDGIKTSHPDLLIQEIDLFRENLPSVAGENIDSKYTLMTGQPLSAGAAENWSSIESLVLQFQQADYYLISTPMWNFTIPYVLKYYIDAIIQPGYLFKYDEQGVPHGLVTGKKMVCVTTTGGSYAPGTPMHAMNFVEPYLRAIFGFVGITDISFITAGPMDYTPEVREMALNQAKAEAMSLIATMA